MPRNRGREQTSTAPTVASVLSLLLFIGLGVGIVILKAQRRAARNDTTSYDSGSSGGGGGSYTPPTNPPGGFPSNPPTPQPGPQPGAGFPPSQPVQPPEPQPQPPNLPPGVGKTEPAGGFFAKNDYYEYREDGALLTGFEVGYGKVGDTTVIAYLRPIWLTAKGEVHGTAYGKSQGTTAVVKARQGYAVGGIVIAGGGALEGFALTYMRIGQKSLDKNDLYTSEWYGEPSRKPDANGMKSGNGPFVIGIYGKRFEDKKGNNFDDGGGICTIGFYLWVKE